MRRVGRIVVGAVAVLWMAAVLQPRLAAAQSEVEPYFYVIVDTSGSMAIEDVANSCGQANWRLNAAKCVLADMINAFGEVQFGLGQFRMECGIGFWGEDVYGSDCNPSSGASSIDADRGQTLVGIAEHNHDELVSYVDFLPDYPDDTAQSCPASDTPQEILVNYTGYGLTPLAGSLRAAQRYYQGSDPDVPGTPATSDPYFGCRPYGVILLTDGDETCAFGSDPSQDTNNRNAVVAAATELRSTSIPGVGGIDIPTYVIGFGISEGDPDIEAIAVAGGTDAPGTHRGFYANDETSLALAFAQIVEESLLYERCNGVDDDCDGAEDEDFPSLGGDCTAGVGACLRSGTYVCTADELGVECTATPGSPTAEVCNDIDDDCDGLIDDGISCTPCTPQTEVCNGRDDDCDGEVDEGALPSVGEDCGIDIGVCEPGLTECSGGTIVCGGGTGPSTEVCDGDDNDCDTVVDGLSRKCYPVATPGCDIGDDSCTGICQFGIETCPVGGPGSWGACTGAVTPAPDDIPCNGLDDDCDGEIDETNGAEICDGTDNDCDGAIDEGNPGGGGPCGTPPFVGICKQGTEQCIGGSLTCIGEVDPGTEKCDGLDNDCNGETDDGLPSPFGDACGSDVGECVPGTLECVAGAPECVDEVPPAAEVCNTLDDNCNGLVDETDPDLGAVCDDAPGGVTVTTEEGECRFGVLICTVGGDLECFGAIGPTPEVCNGLDDDCDGAVDEDFPTLGDACNNGMLGVCLFDGVLVCNEAGDGVECDAPAGLGTTETCNGLDDDCDGETDEDPLPLVGTECSPAIGECVPGLWECNDGTLECGSPSTGSPEICNAEDDDCDGFVDESPLPGEGEDCTDPGFEEIGDTGECEFGATMCVAGGIECVGYQGPEPEVCNGLDDDCDGEADDFAECPAPSNLCHEGSCVIPCDMSEFPCPAGFVCTTLPEGRYCLADPCADVSCSPGEYCDTTTGECIDLCEGVTCATGEECRNGFCLDCFDLPARCMEGELCIADDDGVGQCVDNPCDPNPCMANEVCTDGACTSCECAPMEVCIDGACVEDKCIGVSCSFDQVCNPDTGDCENTNCESVRCEDTEVCVPLSGECIPDPCLANDCPAGEECVLLPNGGWACEPPPPPDVDYVTAAGGGCATAPASSPRDLGILLLLAVALIARRRRS